MSRRICCCNEASAEEQPRSESLKSLGKEERSRRRVQGKGGVEERRGSASINDDYTPDAEACNQQCHGNNTLLLHQSRQVIHLEDKWSLRFTCAVARCHSRTLDHSAFYVCFYVSSSLFLYLAPNYSPYPMSLCLSLPLPLLRLSLSLSVTATHSLHQMKSLLLSVLRFTLRPLSLQHTELCVHNRHRCLEIGSKMAAMWAIHSEAKMAVGPSYNEHLLQVSVVVGA